MGSSVHLLSATASLNLTGVLAHEAVAEDAPAEAVVQGGVRKAILSTDGLAGLVLVGGADAVAEGALTLIEVRLGGRHQIARDEGANEAGVDVGQATYRRDRVSSSSTRQKRKKTAAET